MLVVRVGVTVGLEVVWMSVGEVSSMLVGGSVREGSSMVLVASLCEGVGESLEGLACGVAVGTGESSTAVMDASRSYRLAGWGSLSRIISSMIARPTSGMRAVGQSL